MTVAATFCVHLRGLGCLPEGEIDRDFAAHEAALRADDRSYGQIHLVAPGQPAAILDDELWALVQNLCFLPVPDLLAGRPVEVPLFRYADSYWLRPEDDAIQLTGPRLPEVHYPRAALLHALYDCGRRFIAFLRRLDNPELVPTIELLEEEAQAAGRALGI